MDFTSESNLWQRYGVTASQLFCHHILFCLFFFIDLGKLETPQLFALLAIGLVITLVCVVLAIKAITDLWNKGHKGGMATVKAMIIALIILIPFTYYIGLAFALPLANDVSTNYFDPPQFSKIEELRIGSEEKGMNQIVEYDTDYARELVTAYPQLGPRRYPAGAERVLQAVRFVIEDNGWKIISSQGIPETTDEEKTAELDDNSQEKPENAEADEEVTAGSLVIEDIVIEVSVSSLIVGFKNDAVIRIVSEDVNTLVDVRSSSRWGSHDFGYNSRIINGFLSQLDLALLGIAGEG